MSTLNISKYDESSKIITCSNSLGDHPVSTLIAQENVQDLYRIECKVLNYIDDNTSLSHGKEAMTKKPKEKDTLAPHSGNSTTCTRVNFRLDFLFVAKRFIISYIV